MRFTRSELKMIYKYGITTKEGIMKTIRDGQSIARDGLIRGEIPLKPPHREPQPPDGKTSYHNVVKRRFIAASCL